MVAKTLCAALGAKHAVQCVVGGTNVKTDIRDLTNLRCAKDLLLTGDYELHRLMVLYSADILIATPGRLIDLLENANIGGRFTKLSG